MLLIYGEGSRAFWRLQEAILAETEDYTIFLWQMDIVSWRAFESSSRLQGSSVEEAIATTAYGRSVVSHLATGSRDFNIEPPRARRYSDFQQELRFLSAMFHPTG